MILRLKQYMSFIYGRYFETLKRLKPLGAQVDENMIINSFAVTGQTVLFFNQSEPDRSFEEWSNDPDIPDNYLLEINHCMSLLINSAFWAIHAINLEYEDFPNKPKFYMDLENFRITEAKNETDGLTRQFFNTCNMLHNRCPQNTRLRESLIHLIWAYLTAKELTNHARELSQYDRINYLKQLTKYS